MEIEMECTLLRNLHVRITAFLYLILILPQSLGISSINTCTNVVSSCPTTRESWFNRAKTLNCQQSNYTCIRTTTNELVEGCSPAYGISKGIGRCPEVIFCDGGYPVLTFEERFKECPEYIYGCPLKNHSSFTVHELHKYPACLVKEFSDLSVTTESQSFSELSESQTFSPVTTNSSSESSMETSTSYKNYVRKKDRDNAVNQDILVILIIVLTVITCIIIITLCLYICRSHLRRLKFDVEGLLCSSGRGFKRQYRYKKNGIGKLKKYVLGVNDRQSRTFPLSPLHNYSKVSFLEMFVLPVIRPCALFSNNDVGIDVGGIDKRLCRYRKIDNQTTEWFYNQKEIHHFFTKNGHQISRVFLLGDAGCGKTTYCKCLLQLWSNTRDKRISKSLSLGPLEKSLKEYDFVFFVPLRRNDDSKQPMADIICEEVLGEDYYLREELNYVLSSKRYRCLILVDDVGGWNPKQSSKYNTQCMGFPKLRGLSNCTILITSRTSKFEAVSDHVKSSDAVFQILGLDKKGSKLFARKFGEQRNLSLDKKVYDEMFNPIWKNTEYSLLTPTVNPLLASTIIHFLYQEDAGEISLANCLVQFVGTLIEIAEQRNKCFLETNTFVRNTSRDCLFKVFKNDFFLRNLTFLQKLGEFAYKETLDGNDSFECPTFRLMTRLGLSESEFDYSLNVGLISKSDKNNGLITKVSIRFLVPCVKDLLAAVFIVTKEETIDIKVLHEVGNEPKMSSIMNFVHSFQQPIEDVDQLREADVTNNFERTEKKIVSKETFEPINFRHGDKSQRPNNGLMDRSQKAKSDSIYRLQRIQNSPTFKIQDSENGADEEIQRRSNKTKTIELSDASNLQRFKSKSYSQIQKPVAGDTRIPRNSTTLFIYVEQINFDKTDSSQDSK